MHLNRRKLILHIVSLLIVLSLAYLVSCDSKTGITDPPPPPPPPTPNPYGEGNGKITFYRTQQIAGPVIIKISNRQLNDSLIWLSAPNCDTSIASSVILKAGDYIASIEGAVFICSYQVKVEERKCKVLDYTNCSGGTTGCWDITGTWLRTDDGPCPNCKGLKVRFENGFGEVIYTPPGCRFPLGDTKWKDFDQVHCTIRDMARDQYGGSPEYQEASLQFFDKNTFNLNGPSGTIPYSRILNADEGKNSANIIINSPLINLPADTTELQPAN